MNGPIRDVAAKKCRDPRTEKENIRIENEIAHLKSCKHPNIVSFFGTTMHEKRIVILMEYAECGSLRDYLHDERRKASDVARLNWMLQMAKVSFNIKLIQSVSTLIFPNFHSSLGSGIFARAKDMPS